MTLLAVAIEAVWRNCRRFTTYSETEREDRRFAGDYILIAAPARGGRRIAESVPMKVPEKEQSRWGRSKFAGLLIHRTKV